MSLKNHHDDHDEPCFPPIFLFAGETALRNKIVVDNFSVAVLYTVEVE